MENNEEKKFIEDKHYKVKCGNEYYVRKKTIESGDLVISNYYIVCKKRIDGRDVSFPKKVRFRSGVELKDNTKIVIKDFFEDVMENKKDKFNPIWHIFIKDFEIIEEPDDMNGAIIDYQDKLDNLRIDNERQESDFLTF